MVKIEHMTIPNGNKVILLDEVDSTNTFASNLSLNEKIPEGTIIMAHSQSSGKGQKGTSWISEPRKNLTFSIIIQPDFLFINDQFMLSKMAAMVVLQFIKKNMKEGDQIKIKWPNDIYVNSDKIAGILIENSIRNSKLRQSIIGVGINVNQINFPSEINATSLSKLTNNEFDLMNLLNDLCESFNLYYNQLKSGRWDSLNKSYLDHLYKLNQWSCFDWKNERIEAKITGVNTQGKLMFQLKNEEIGVADLKEIIFVREP